MSVLLDNILVKLRILGKIHENGRISTITTEHLKIEEENAIQSFKRWITGDSRDRTVKVLNDLVENVIEISNSIMNSKFMNLHKSCSSYEQIEFNKQCCLLKDLATEIESSLKGLANLHGTYSTDATISSKLEVMIAKLTTHSNKIHEKLEDVQHSERRGRSRSNSA